MLKQKVYEGELVKLTELFKDVDESNKKLVEGLIQDAAFLYAENYVLKQALDKTGMIKFHHDNPTLQKPLPAAKEYRQNLNSYAVVIKTLSGVLQKRIGDDDDDLEEFE
jgi:regulator of replication initiation timing